MATICIDFGTSSIRAALLDDTWPPIPLSIEAETDGIDEASIPSAIFITKDKRQVYFGQQAIRQGRLLKDHVLFETSPKRWFFENEIFKLDQSLDGDIDLSRMELIAALLAFAGNKVRNSASHYIGDNDSIIEYRISHPIWPDSTRGRAELAYAAFCKLIQRRAGEHLAESMSTADLRGWRDQWRPAQRPATAVTDPDVQEPVAAALELLGPLKSNDLSTTLVVDVGAGTTDIAVFRNLNPDIKARDNRHKLVSLADPTSIYYAGDAIDRVVLELAAQRISQGDRQALAEFSVDIRRNKEQLFSSGSVALPGRGNRLYLRELEASEDIQDIGRRIEAHVREVLESATILKPEDRSDRLDIVFAGGGAEVGFLRAAVCAGAKLGQPKISQGIIEITTPTEFPVAAARTRLAVALGGTVPVADWPKGKATPDTVRRPGLGRLARHAKSPSKE